MDFHILIITAVMILLDVVMGFAGACKEGDVNSGKLREGLWHKAGFIGLIAVSYIIEYAAAYAELGFDVPTVLATCVYVIVTELVSVCENLCVLNLHLVNSPLGMLVSKDKRVIDAVGRADEAGDYEPSSGDN